MCRGNVTRGRGAISTPAALLSRTFPEEPTVVSENRVTPEADGCLSNSLPAASGWFPKDRMQLIIARSEERQEKKITVTLKYGYE